jgi:hypothetical protein
LAGDGSLRSASRSRLRGGLDVSTEVVLQGHAWIYRQYTSDEPLTALENEARAAEVCEAFAVTTTKSQANGSSITADVTGQSGYSLYTLN